MVEIELKKQGKIKRLTNRTFKFDSRIKDGWYSAAYFLKTTKIVNKHAKDRIVTMQFFQRKDNVVLCGIDEAIALLHTFADNPQNLIIEALNDGDIIQSGEPVLKITGHYQDFGFLESLIDGILARRSSVATHVYNTVNIAKPTPVFFMGDRQDVYINQQGDGYSAYIGGIAAQCTYAHGEWWGSEGGGTMPHALIQIMGGDTVKAAKAYADVFPNEKVTALVDFHNDVIKDSLLVAEVLGERLSAVRVDTSDSLTDHYFDDKDIKDTKINGVNPTLIKALRKALDENGYTWVKIVVSSGFDVEKIKWFKQEEAPVDSYGVGSSLLKINIGFTGDLVKLDGKDLAKEGRKEIENLRLERVEYFK